MPNGDIVSKDKEKLRVRILWNKGKEKHLVQHQIGS